MKADLRKTTQSKRQTRHELAALPFTEKLRILERLREDLLVGLADTRETLAPTPGVIEDREESLLFELVSLGLERLSPPDAETLLRELTRWESPSFYRAFESLGDWATRLQLRPRFAAEWFPALVRRIGNDSAARGFWNALGGCCAQHPHDALDVLRCLRRPRGEAEASVAACLLGTLRSLDLDASGCAAFARLEGEFSGDSTVARVYARSWVQTACRGKLRLTDLEFLTQRMWAAGAEARDEAFLMVCEALLSPAISPECFAFGLDWLRGHASESISPLAKSRVVDLAAQLRAEHRREAAGLILAVQPIAPEQRSAWQRIEHFMVALLDDDLALFNDFFVKFARRNSENWLHLLQVPRQFEWLLSEMRGKDMGKPIGELMSVDERACRLVGRFFFDQLELLGPAANPVCHAKIATST